jgi:hypothetical protein
LVNCWSINRHQGERTGGKLKVACITVEMETWSHQNSKISCTRHAHVSARPQVLRLVHREFAIVNRIQCRVRSIRRY